MGFVSLLEDIEKRIEKMSKEAASTYSPTEVSIEAQRRRLEREKAHLTVMAKQLGANYNDILTSITHPENTEAHIQFSIETLHKEHKIIKKETNSLRKSLKRLRIEEASLQSKVKNLLEHINSLNIKLEKLRVWDDYIKSTQKSIDSTDRTTFRKFLNEKIQKFAESHPIAVRIEREAKIIESDLQDRIKQKESEIAKILVSLEKERMRTSSLRKQLAEALSKQKTTPKA